MEKEILARSNGNEHIRHLTEMKGIGTITAATIVSEIGSIKQFESAVKLQSYGGKVPDMSGSAGKTVQMEYREQGTATCPTRFMSLLYHLYCTGIMNSMSYSPGNS